MITQERLQELMEYNPETGLFTRLINRHKHKAGEICGTLDPNGRICIGVDGEAYWAHRLVFLYMTGNWPTHDVDHINRDPKDNRWVNLREATHAENMRNRSRNSKKLKGAYKRGKGWVSQLSKDRKIIYLGYFQTEQEAHNAYCLAAKELNGEFASYGETNA